VKYTATMNTPGYLPWSDDDPPVFDTASEAWRYLADQRRNQEDDAWNAEDQAGGEPYSDIVTLLENTASGDTTEGTVYGNTPGNDSPHDLGIAYCVTETEEERR